MININLLPSREISSSIKMKTIHYYVIRFGLALRILERLLSLVLMNLIF